MCQVKCMYDVQKAQFLSHLPTLCWMKGPSRQPWNPVSTASLAPISHRHTLLGILLYPWLVLFNPFGSYLFYVNVTFHIHLHDVVVNNSNSHIHFVNSSLMCFSCYDKWRCLLWKSHINWKSFSSSSRHFFCLYFWVKIVQFIQIYFQKLA